MNSNHYQITPENELSLYLLITLKESNTEQFNEKIQNFIKLNNSKYPIFIGSKYYENLNKLDKDKEYWKLFILLS